MGQPELTTDAFAELTSRLRRIEVLLSTPR
jgi:hypothetical protein